MLGGWGAEFVYAAEGGIQTSNGGYSCWQPDTKAQPNEPHMPPLNMKAPGESGLFMTQTQQEPRTDGKWETSVCLIPATEISIQLTSSACGC